MDEFLKWLAANEEWKWIFSGIGVAVVGWIGRLVFQGRRAGSSLEIRSGDKSNIIQAGRDIRIETKSKSADVEER